MVAILKFKMATEDTLEKNGSNSGYVLKGIWKVKNIGSTSIANFALDYITPCTIRPGRQVRRESDVRPGRQVRRESDVRPGRQVRRESDVRPGRQVRRERYHRPASNVLPNETFAQV